MNYLKLKKQWQQEENFDFQGWDFSHMDGRWESQSIPWDYRKVVLSYLNNYDNLLDMGTGGGEFLLSLNHPYKLTTATEAYPPNVELCKNKLSHLGINVEKTYDVDKLPFDNNCFDIIINRHASFDLKEVYRTLKPDGIFITQQVGGKNNNDLSKKLIENFKPQFPKNTLENYIVELKELGFKKLKKDQIYPYVRFFDIGALVYFAKIIEWEFPGFTVETSFNKLCKCQKELMQKGFIQGTEHRFLFVAKKL